MSPVLSVTVPAPTDGIVTEVNRDLMSPTQALWLENCYFQGGVLRRRPAILSTGYPTGLTNSFGTTFVYNRATGTQELLASGSASKLYKLSSGGAPALPGTASADVYLSTVQVRTLAGGTLLFVADGVNRVGVYDGTNFNIAGFTIGGAADSTLEVVTNYKNRLFFARKNTCELYYTPVATITGALSTYEIGFYFQRGGRILWMGTWSGNAGNGLDDYLICISDRGEVLMFAGTDPAVAANWSMVGRFFLPKSTSHLNFVNKESDVLCLTVDGLYALSSVISLGQGESLVGLSDPIRGLYKQLIANNANNFARPTYVPELQSIYIPIYSTIYIYGAGDSPIYIGFLAINLINNSWALHTWSPSKMDSTLVCPVYYDKSLYFVNQDIIAAKYDVQYLDSFLAFTSDYFDDIAMTIQTSFNYLDDREHVKRFISASPYLSLLGGVSSYDVSAQCAILCNNKTISQANLSTLLTDGAFTTSVDGPNIAWLNCWGKSLSLIFKFPKSTASTGVSAINIIYEQGGYD